PQSTRRRESEDTRAGPWVSVPITRWLPYGADIRTRLAGTWLRGTLCGRGSCSVSHGSFGGTLAAFDRAGDDRCPRALILHPSVLRGRSGRVPSDRCLVRHRPVHRRR